jgi:uncharacterized caspase-like protein
MMQLFFIFLGHGVSIDDKTGICPYDYFNKSEIIADEEILNILENSPAQYKFCFIEACKTKIRRMGIEQADLKQRFNENRKNVKDNIVFITSTEVGEDSYEYPDVGGVFSYYLIDGVKGKADKDSNKTITIKELFDYLKSEVTKYTDNKQKPQINKTAYREIPFLIIN